MGTGTATSCEFGCSEGWQMDGLHRMEKEERLVWIPCGVRLEKLHALLQKHQVDLFEIVVWSD